MKATTLKEKIRERGIKQEWLCREVGIAPNTMSRIVHGKVVPNVIVALKIARALGTTVEELWPLEEFEGRQ